MKAVRLSVLLAASASLIATRAGGDSSWTTAGMVAAALATVLGTLHILAGTPRAGVAALAGLAASAMTPVSPRLLLAVPAPVVAILFCAGVLALFPPGPSTASGSAGLRVGWRPWLRLAPWLCLPAAAYLAWSFLAPMRLARMAEGELVVPVLAALVLLGVAFAIHSILGEGESRA